MKRIDSVNARADVNGIGKIGFHDNADLEGQDATYLTPDWANAVQEEIANVIEFADLELDEENNAQLLEAIQKLALRPLQNFFAVGSWHGTDNTAYDPATALEAIFGYRTKWRLRPYAPYGVNNLSEAILSEIPISGTRAALASKTVIWKRYPDDYLDPIFALSADALNINEGQTVTITLDADNVADGTEVGYVISGVSVADISANSLTGFFVVAAGTASLTLNILADQLTENTETMKVALLDDPSTYVNITINDTSKNQTQITPSFTSYLIYKYANYNERYFNLTAGWSNMDDHIGSNAELRLSGSLLPWLKEYPFNPVGLDWSNPVVLPAAQSTYTFTINRSSNPGTTIQDVRALDSTPTGQELTLRAELFWDGSVRRSQTITVIY